MRTRIGTERNAIASESCPRRFHSRFISHKPAGSVHSTRRRATRGAGNRDASRPPPSNASHAATIARRDDQASPARVRTRGTHRRRVVALALGVFAEWKRAHGEEFPRGARGWKCSPRAPFVGYPNTSGSRTRGSRRARRRRAVSRTPWVWTRARGGRARGGDQAERVHLHGAAMFDPSKERYAVFERCLTDARVKTIRREIIDANPRPTRAKRRAGRGRRVAGRTSRTRAGHRPRPRVDSTCTAAPR